MPNIRRINNYTEKGFNQEVLNQHGAFLVEDKYKCQFKIIDERTALLECDRIEDYELAIEEFRFYSENITTFVDKNHSIVKNLPEINFERINILDIQPSQFYVSVEKVEALEKYINGEDDIVIPVAMVGDDIVSLDGHTRLYIALHKGFETVRVYYTKPFDSISGFVREAKNRKVNNPKDLTLLSAQEYNEKWHKFCDDYFASKK